MVFNRGFSLLSQIQVHDLIKMLSAVENAPEGLFEQIEKESEDKCLYRCLFLDHTYGSGRICTTKEIK